MTKHTITTDNYQEAEAAIRDILFMYRDMIRSYDGFGHNIDIGAFAFFPLVDADVYEEPGTTLAMDMRLLHEGSAVAMLCMLSDYWDETDGLGLSEWPFAIQLKNALNEGRLDHLPLARKAMVAGLHEAKEFTPVLSDVYKTYVLAYFERLIATKE